MPRPFMERHILDGCSVSLDEQMGGNVKVFDGFEVGMLIWIQAISKKLANIVVVEFCRREANAMDYDEGDDTIMGALIKIW